MNGYGHIEDNFANSSYKGTFLNNQKFGNGLLVDGQGKYSGEFKNDMKNGKG